MNFEEFTAAELTDALKAAGLPVSGNKATKSARLVAAGVTPDSLNDQQTEAAVIDADLVSAESEDSAGFAARLLNSREVAGRSIPFFGAIIVAIVMLSATTVVLIAGPLVMDLIRGEPEYHLIDFDPSEARDRAEHLVSLGHPEWKGRMSGSYEELMTAESNKANFTEYGLSSTLEEFEVPMFEIQAEPRLYYCIPGTYPAGVPVNIVPCGPQDFNRVDKEFDHRIDFVIQGYSGTASYGFGDGLQLVNLSNGTDDALWAEASGEVGVVWSSAGVGSNTDIYAKAIGNDLRALFLVNVKSNCGKVEADDCVPIFKTVDIEGLMGQTGGNLPDTIPFIQLSKNTGEELQEVFDQQDSNNARLGLDIDVDNQGTRPVRVPCGILEGKDDKVIMFGGHHDTVYNGPGAIDDTTGTATVLELARQFALLAQVLGQPDHTMKFCTWGGEEEGLHGSKAWVAKHAEELRENLIIYINLDMNHVDADPERGNGLTLFGNYQSDVDHIERITEKFKAERSDLASKYSITIRTLDGPKNSETGMPYNSDHGPFVYDLPEDENDSPGRVLVCYGSGSWEYHTYMDNMDRFNEESLAVSAIIYGTYARYLAWGEK
jgi:hypothetical protein